MALSTGTVLDLIDLPTNIAPQLAVKGWGLLDEATTPTTYTAILRHAQFVTYHISIEIVIQNSTFNWQGTSTTADNAVITVGLGNDYVLSSFDTSLYKKYSTHPILNGQHTWVAEVGDDDITIVIVDQAGEEYASFGWGTLGKKTTSLILPKFVWANSWDHSAATFQDPNAASHKIAHNGTTDSPTSLKSDFNVIGTENFETTKNINAIDSIYTTLHNEDTIHSLLVNFDTTESHEVLLRPVTFDYQIGIDAGNPNIIRAGCSEKLNMCNLMNYIDFDQTVSFGTNTFAVWPIAGAGGAGVSDSGIYGMGVLVGP